MILTCGATYLNACVLSGKELEEQWLSLHSTARHNELTSFYSKGRYIKSKNDIYQACDDIAKGLSLAKQTFLEAQKLLQDLLVKNETPKSSIEEVKTVLDSVGLNIQNLKFVKQGGILSDGVFAHTWSLKKWVSRKYTIKSITDPIERKEMLAKIEKLENDFIDLYKEVEKLEAQAEGIAKAFNVPFSANIDGWY
jgi:hypothetical protein